MKLVDILARDLSEWPGALLGWGPIRQDGKGLLRTAGPERGTLLLLGLGQEFEVAEDHAKASVTRDQWQAARDALGWDGEGLPPVGICEAGYPQHEPPAKREWRPVFVLAHGMFRGTPVAICQDGDTILTAEAKVFRPIRTAEQLAAAERERGIEALCKAGAGRSGPPLCQAAGEALYDAGCRVPEVQS